MTDITSLLNKYYPRTVPINILAMSSLIRTSTNEFIDNDRDNYGNRPTNTRIFLKQYYYVLTDNDTDFTKEFNNIKYNNILVITIKNNKKGEPVIYWVSLVY